MQKCLACERRVRPERGATPDREFEPQVADGPVGQLLAREQAAAIREVLAWIGCMRSGKCKPGKGTPSGLYQETC
jgi:hypothetical protein